MSITDELRAYTFIITEEGSSMLRRLTDIADRIDAEYEKALSEQPCTIDMVPMTDERMAEHGWVRLPKDADGEYVHIGDVMVYADGNTCPMKVVALVPPSVFQTEDGPRYADMCRHKPTTVEDVLQEMLYKSHIYDEREMELLPDLIAEYASKFQLKENK